MHSSVISTEDCKQIFTRIFAMPDNTCKQLTECLPRLYLQKGTWLALWSVGLEKAQRQEEPSVQWQYREAQENGGKQKGR